MQHTLHTWYIARRQLTIIHGIPNGILRYRKLHSNMMLHRMTLTTSIAGTLGGRFNPSSDRWHNWGRGALLDARVLDYNKRRMNNKSEPWNTPGVVRHVYSNNTSGAGWPSGVWPASVTHHIMVWHGMASHDTEQCGMVCCVTLVVGAVWYSLSSVISM